MPYQAFTEFDLAQRAVEIFTLFDRLYRLRAFVLQQTPTPYELLEMDSRAGERVLDWRPEFLRTSAAQSSGL